MPKATRDVVVTCPADFWARWLAEGDLPGDPAEEAGVWDFSVGSSTPRAAGAGSRVYVVAHGLLRGYSEAVSIDPLEGRPGVSFVRGGGAVACTLRDAAGAPLRIPGFRGWRYAWFDRVAVSPFPSFATEGVPEPMIYSVRRVLAARSNGPSARAELRRRSLAGLPLF